MSLELIIILGVVATILLYQLRNMFAQPVKKLVASSSAVLKRSTDDSTKKDVKDKKNSRPIGKWVLYGIGIAVFIAFMGWADVLYQMYMDSGFSFAEDTGPGRLIGSQYGQDVADAAAWLPILLVLLILVFFVAKALGSGTIVNLVYFAVLVVLLYGVWLIGRDLWYEHTDKPHATMSREQELNQRVTKPTKYHGPFGTHRAQEVTLDADRWHSFDWEYQRCVFFYPRTGIETSEHNATQQYRLMSLGTSRTVWVRTLWVGESWTPPGSNTSNTC